MDGGGGLHPAARYCSHAFSASKVSLEAEEQGLGRGWSKGVFPRESSRALQLLERVCEWSGVGWGE